MSKERLQELMDEYWNLARAEGIEGRDHDTPDGDAQRVLSAIEETVTQIEQRAFKHGTEQATLLFEAEIDRLLPNYISSAVTDQARRDLLEDFARFARKVKSTFEDTGEPTSDSAPKPA